MFAEQVSELDYIEGIGQVYGQIGSLSYAPDLQPVGSGSAGTYYPRDTSADAAALNYLGFFPDPMLSTHVGTKGTQAADMAAQAGAWDPEFRTAVTDFQQAYGLTADGWIGPGTRTKLAAEVAKKNANGGGIVPPIPNIPNLPNVPNNGGGGGAVQPASASSSNALLWGLGALAAVGVGWWVLSD
jgi:hypothetical protein